MRGHKTTKNHFVKKTLSWLGLSLFAVATITSSLLANPQTVHAQKGAQNCASAYGRNNSSANNYVLVALSDYKEGDTVVQHVENIVCGNSITSDSKVALAQWQPGRGRYVAPSWVYIYTGESSGSYGFLSVRQQSDNVRAVVYNVGGSLQATIGNQGDPLDVDDPANLLAVLEDNDTRNQIGDVPDEEEREPTCADARDAGGALNWFLCPIINFIDDGLGFVDRNVSGLLEVDRQFYDNDSMRSAWGNIRDIAFILLVPMALFMVISTALGFEFVSTYTVKKALPRFIIAAMFISASYILGVFLIDFFNAVGSGILGVLTSPFGDEASSLSLGDMFPEGNFFSGLFNTMAGIGGLIFIAIFYGPPLLLLAGTALLVLLARQIFLAAALLVAPLAILSWVFPQSTRLWSLWSNSFIKLLFMYPLIMAIVAAGRIFAWVIYSGDAGGFWQGGIIFPLMTIAAYTLPYAAIPFTFKFAGGVFSNLAGIVNDKEKGLFDRHKNWRTQKRQEGMHKFKTGSFQQRTPIGGALNAAGRRVGAGWKGRFGGVGRFGATQASVVQAAQVSNAAAEFTKTEPFNAVRDNDNVLRAAALGRSRAEAAQRLKDVFGDVFGYTDEDAEKYARQAEATIGFGAVQQVAAAQQLINTGTGYKNIDQLVSTLGYAAGGNETTASNLAGYANAMTKKVDRGDLAPGFSTLDSMVKAQAGLAGSEWSEGDRESTIAAAQLAATRVLDPVSMVRGKKDALQNHAATLSSNLSQSRAVLKDNTASQADKDRALSEAKRTIAQINQLDASRGYGNEENQGVINSLVGKTDPVKDEILSIIGKRPDAQEHMGDIERFSAARGFDPNDPRSRQAGSTADPGGDDS